MTEGLCHNCDKWIPMLSSKNVDAVVKELIWWKVSLLTPRCVYRETDAFYPARQILSRSHFD